MSRVRGEVTIGVLAKAPLPGAVKTRLIPALGIEGAAALQARFIARALETALAADVGPVTLWAAPDEAHPLFQKLASRVRLARQPNGDLGNRMFAALAEAHGPSLVIGTDCPILAAEHLRAAADVLRCGIDVVVIPTDDGGYALIGMNHADAGLFGDMPWSTPAVMAQTRRRLARHGLSWREPAKVWDVDVPEDLTRLRTTGLRSLL